MNSLFDWEFSDIPNYLKLLWYNKSKTLYTLPVICSFLDKRTNLLAGKAGINRNGRTAKPSLKVILIIYPLL